MVCVVPAGLEILLPSLENAYVSFFCVLQLTHDNNDIYAVANFGFSLTSFTVVENAGPLSGSITLTTAGQIDREIQVVIQTVASGSATGKYTQI